MIQVFLSSERRVFVKILRRHKPRKIYNPNYSSQVPCWFIESWHDDGQITWRAHGFAKDVSSKKTDISGLFDHMKYQGVGDSYIHPNPPAFAVWIMYASGIILWALCIAQMVISLVCGYAIADSMSYYVFASVVIAIMYRIFLRNFYKV